MLSAAAASGALGALPVAAALLGAGVVATGAALVGALFAGGAEALVAGCSGPAAGAPHAVANRTSQAEESVVTCMSGRAS